MAFTCCWSFSGLIAHLLTVFQCLDSSESGSNLLPNRFAHTRNLTSLPVWTITILQPPQWGRDALLGCTHTLWWRLIVWGFLAVCVVSGQPELKLNLCMSNKASDVLSLFNLEVKPNQIVDLWAQLSSHNFSLPTLTACAEFAVQNVLQVSDLYLNVTHIGVTNSCVMNWNDSS